MRGKRDDLVAKLMHGLVEGDANAIRDLVEGDAILSEWLDQHTEPALPPFTGDDDRMAEWLDWHLDLYEKANEAGVQEACTAFIATLSEAEIKWYKESLAAHDADEFGNVELLRTLNPHLARFYRPPPRPKHQKFRKIMSPKTVALLRAAIDTKYIRNVLWPNYYKGLTRGEHDKKAEDFAAGRWGISDPKQILNRIDKEHLSDTSWERIFNFAIENLTGPISKLSDAEREQLIKIVRGKPLSDSEKKRLINLILRKGEPLSEKRSEENLYHDETTAIVHRLLKL